MLGIVAATFGPVWLILDTLAATRRGWNLSFPDQSLLLAMLVWSGSVLILALMPSGRRWFLRRSLKIVLSLVTLFITLVLVDRKVSERFADPSSPLRLPRLIAVFEPEADGFPGVRGTSRFRTNEWGLRGYPLPTDSQSRRILCIGGGTTECLYLDDDETWPHRLMDELNSLAKKQSAPPFWVSGGGYGGVSISHWLKWAATSSLIDQVDTIICLFGAEEVIHDLLVTPDLPSIEKGPVWTKSGLGRAWTTLTRGPSPELLRADLQGVHHREAQGSIPSRERADFDLPSIDRFIEQVRQLKRILDRRGKRVIFVTQPSLWDDFMFELWIRRLRYCKGDSTPDGIPKPTPALAMTTLDQYNQRLAETCDDRNMELIDLAPKMNGRADYFYDDLHFSEEGCRVAAKEVARYISQYPVAPPITPKGDGSIDRPVYLPAHVFTCLSFRARSSKPGPYRAIIRPTNRQSTKWSLEREFTLENSWKHFWWPIEISSDSGPAEFSLFAPDMEAVELSNFSSARFSTPLIFQVKCRHEASKPFITVAPDQIYPTVTNVTFLKPIPGDESSVRLTSGAMAIVEKTKYVFNVKCFTEKERTIRVQCTSASNPDQLLGLDQVCKISPPESQISLEFQSTQAAEDACLAISINQEPTNFRILGPTLDVQFSLDKIDRGETLPIRE
jgi:hypothetical protein